MIESIKSLFKLHKPLFILLFFFTILRLLVVPQFDLGVDEAHYLLYAKYLDFSYFDHPPLVGWIHYLLNSTFGYSEFFARLSAIFIGIFSSISIYILILKISNKSELAFIATLALNASFLFNALFMMLMPDTLLFILIVPIIFVTLNIEKSNLLKDWLWLGLLLGFAGLAKYTAILFIIPIILYFIIKKRFTLFYTPKIIPSIVIASIMIIPVLYWNYQNEWISFAFQSSHVAGEKSLNITGFFQSIVAQIGAYNPFLVILSYMALYKALKSKNDILFLTALFGFVILSFFTYNSLYNRALPHWSSLFYMLFIPLGIYYFYESYKKYSKFAIGFGLVITIILYSELAFKWIPLPDYQSAHRDIYGYPQMLEKANGYIKNNNTQVLATHNWSLASRILYYNQNYKSDVVLVDTKYDQFDIWQERNNLNKNYHDKDLLFISTHFLTFNLHNYLKCDKLVNEESFDIILNDAKVNTFHFTWCKNYQGFINE